MNHDQIIKPACMLLLCTPSICVGIENNQTFDDLSNYRLLSDAPNHVLIDPNGMKHFFNLTTNTNNPNQSIIEYAFKFENETYITLIDQTKLVFFGSYLVKHTNNNGIINQINYSNGKMNVDLRCETEETTSNDVCTSDEKYRFSNPSLNSNTIQIDIRPPDCKSYFDDYLHTRRGLNIEKALEHLFAQYSYTATPQTFPVIDLMNGNTAHVIKSRDLSKPVFQAQDALYETLKQDIIEIERLFENRNTHTANFQGQSTTITQSQVDNYVLNIVIQNGLATDSQKQQLLKILKELEGRKDITLNVIEIP